MTEKSGNDMMEIWLDSWMLAIDASFVIPLRLARIAAGGAAGQREARRMVEEKITANTELGVALMTGALGTDATEIAGKAVRHYGRHVRANRARLSGHGQARRSG